MKRIVIRADSSSTIGTGHIMRDLVLAKRFDNSEVVFVTRELEGNINHKIDEAGYRVETVKSNDIEELDRLIKKHNINMIIIDHYDIDWKYEKQLATRNQQLKIMVLDDTYEKHHCNILLNHNISANPKKYKGLVPKHCEIRCGAKYTLLRDEFVEAKSIKKRGHKRVFKYKILVIMGGADSARLNIPILKALHRVKSISVDVVSTTANKNLEKLKSYCRHKKWINLHINSSKIAKLMIESDLAIVTPSVTLNEVYFMNTPFIAIKTAENQDDMYRFLKTRGHPVFDRFNPQKLKSEIVWKMSN